MLYNAHDVPLGFKIELNRRVNDLWPHDVYRKLFVRFCIRIVPSTNY